MQISPLRTEDTLLTIRQLRAQGENVAAKAVATEALTTGPLATPATTDLAALAGWVLLEVAAIDLGSGGWQQAEDEARQALQAMDIAADLPGACAACLCLGDIAHAAGQPAQASAWWSQATQIGEAAGASPAAARAHLALALQGWCGGSAGDVDVHLEAANALLPVDAAALADVTRISLTVVRARQALAQGRAGEALLLLAALADSKAVVQQPEVRLDVLRLAVAVARHLGDTETALVYLAAAQNVALTLGLAAPLAIVQAERVVLLADNEQWPQALALYQELPAADVAALPAVAAARAEAFAPLAHFAGDTPAALAALEEAAVLRGALGDGPLAVRNQLLWLRWSAGQVADALWQSRAELVAAEAAALARPDLLAQLAVVQAQAAQIQGALTVQLARTAVDQAAASGSVRDQLAALDTCVVAALAAADVGQAAAMADQAMALAAAGNQARWQRRCTIRRAQVHGLAGEPEAAVHLASQMASDAAQAEDHTSLVQALLVLGPLLHRHGRLQEAELVLDQALSTAEQHKLRILRAEAGLERGRLLLTLQRWQLASDTFAATVQQASDVGLWTVCAEARRGQVLALRSSGQTHAAKEAALAALAWAETVAHGGLRLSSFPGFSLELAQLAVDAQAFEEAALWLDRIGAAAEPVLRGEAAIVRARVAIAQRDLDQALGALVEAVALLRRHGPPRSLGAAMFLLGQVYGLLGHGEACGRWLGEALLLTTQHGLPEQHLIRDVLQRMLRPQDAPDVN
jgi:tetratricopeptide (TPR) repeat protein